MNDKIQYFTKNKNGLEPIKFEDGSSIPPKGLLQYKPSTFEIEAQIKNLKQIENKKGYEFKRLKERIQNVGRSDYIMKKAGY